MSLIIDDQPIRNIIGDFGFQYEELMAHHKRPSIRFPGATTTTDDTSAPSIGQTHTAIFNTPGDQLMQKPAFRDA
jgi:hypothetical protein